MTEWALFLFPNFMRNLGHTPFLQSLVWRKKKTFPKDKLTKEAKLPTT